MKPEALLGCAPLLTGFGAFSVGGSDQEHRFDIVGVAAGTTTVALVSAEGLSGVYPEGFLRVARMFV